MIICDCCGKTIERKRQHVATFCSVACRASTRKQHVEARLRERFERFVKRNETDNDACWVWQGSRLRFGHGQFGIGRRSHLAHRVAYELYVGVIPPGLSVLHRCDNPPCVRPAHLFLGTHADNMADCKAKGRNARGETLSLIRQRQDQCNRKLTADEVSAIRRLHHAGQLSMGDIARLFGVSRRNISLVVRRVSWRHVA